MAKANEGYRPLTLEDRAEIDAALGLSAVAPSEYGFANLWLFRDRHAYALGNVPIPHVRGVTYDGITHAIPLAPPGPDDLAAFAESGIRCIYPLYALPQDTGGWSAAWNEADSDYWFDGPAMAAMDFAKAKRAQGRQFVEHGPRFEPWGKFSAKAALAVLDAWFADVRREERNTDLAECREAIALASELGLEGGLVSIAAEGPVAFLLASRRADDVRVVHFAKGRRAHSGAYPWMFAQYAQKSGARLLNFEQDLGNPGLAQSKRAYRPVEIRRKWRLVAPD